MNSGKLDTTVNTKRAVREMVSASGLVNTSDFLSEIVANIMKVRILGLIRAIIKHNNSIQKRVPTPPKKGSGSVARLNNILAIDLLTFTTYTEIAL
ncbi:MAG TPA: hypothetical protein VEG44_05250 [Candidatus Acidoferrales bacterium]|nr:hypothetical protein [Candidatus Acidoferrales bacterium]